LTSIAQIFCMADAVGHPQAGAAIVQFSVLFLRVRP
jgi:hypothetical protein